jgi:hypothetical protein
MNPHLLSACLWHMRAQACSARAEEARTEQEREAALEETARAMDKMDAAIAVYRASTRLEAP